MKLIKEHINFQRGIDPKIAMGIGRSFENLKIGDILQVLKDMPNVNKKTGDYILIRELKRNKHFIKIRYSQSKNLEQL